MQIAVLPLNAGPETRPALARQLSNFACEIARNVTHQEVHAVNYMAQFEDEGVTRMAMVNPAEELNDPEMIKQFFSQAPMQRLVDGLLLEKDGGGTVKVRVFDREDQEVPTSSFEEPFVNGQIFAPTRALVKTLVDQLGGQMPTEMNIDQNLFGTSSAEAFTDFLIGFDAVQYIEKANGQVAREFQPEMAIESLMRAHKADPDWEAPYLTILNLTRLCTQFRIGSADAIEKGLKEIIELNPDDARGIFALGEFYGAVGNPSGSAEQFEKAVVKLRERVATLRKEAEAAKAIGDTAESSSLAAEADNLARDEAPILSRLGVVQLNMGMPANAERNLRRAVELEGDDKPSLGVLSQVLAQTGRAHEIAPMWKAVLDVNPQNPQARVNYAMSLIQTGNEPGGIQAFEDAMAQLEDPVPVKRFFAPVLAQKGDLDRAMDLYEDVLDAAPTEVPVLLEYAQTLKQANREFEVPKVLRDVLATNPDPNTKAQTQAWLIEIEQPKRVEAVEAAGKKVEAGDYAGAISELKPLRTWLADYWKMWAVLASAYNRAEQFEDAEQASVQLLNLFPGCEPGYGELATALSGQGREQEAYNMLRNALAAMGNSVPIALNLGFAAKRIGNTDEARNLAKQIREATGNPEGLRDVLDQLEA
ncbi:MAG: tetratricopeptide repeat protein [Fimbriimonadaceae bacterium]|nr:tetratricopeptide repeat protein [Fimbriimonadaceae bacterium]QYK58325.1 MAG: tetratricopeptide repeat protein [Fimbriimonadaceae bacterium]